MGDGSIIAPKRLFYNSFSNKWRRGFWGKTAHPPSQETAGARRNPAKIFFGAVYSVSSLAFSSRQAVA